MKPRLERFAIVNGYLLGFGALMFYSVASYFVIAKKQYWKENFFDFEGGTNALNRTIIAIVLSIPAQFVLLTGLLHKRASSINWYGIICLMQMLFAIVMAIKIPGGENFIVHIVLISGYIGMSLMTLSLLFTGHERRSFVIVDP
ncbi:uncharacterized protein LOC131693683 [Topomyia yanbarensis]|uniref:uncharacterized protein LOC131693683 n=1 Tax=Topomyia yanbarensis TaxID=2498891 RepID=UPI00273C5005|nr:uncharacterized protein LOC131693683 [Topomyia yanbarensis]